MLSMAFQWHFPILPPIFGAMVPMVPPFLAGSQHETSRTFSGHTGAGQMSTSLEAMPQEIVLKS